MSGLAQPPAELAGAIAAAAKRYGVPASLLTGIWRNEAGSSYPNPYGNASGYGGLFGTSNWAAGPVRQINTNLYTTSEPTSPQAQANAAASILASQLQAHNGDVAQALLSYSGGGYSSVPGQTAGQTHWYDYIPGVDLFTGGNPTLSGLAGAPKTAADAAANAVAGPIAQGFQSAATTVTQGLMHGILYAALLGLAVVLAIFGLIQLSGVGRDSKLATTLRAPLGAAA